MSEENTMPDEALPERESMPFDVVIVGAAPAGLSAAIRLKQLNGDLTVVVLEKGPEVGAHILSGAVIDPIAVNRLVPDWKDDADHPFKVEVTADEFHLRSEKGRSLTMGPGIPNMDSPGYRKILENSKPGGAMLGDANDWDELLTTQSIIVGSPDTVYRQAQW